MLVRRFVFSTAFLLVAACSAAPSGPQPDRVPTIVLESAPAGWSVAEDVAGQLPEGHYWGDWGRDYQGPRGRRLVLVGPREVDFAWRDQLGVWQQEKLGKEALYVWIMPGNYRESWASWLNPHAPPHAELSFAGTNVRVYAKAGVHVTSEARLKAILKHATETGGMDTDGRERTLSWSTWRTDLQRELPVFRESAGR